VRSSRAAARSSAYPRGRGDHFGGERLVLRLQGLPPRARGSLKVDSVKHNPRRPTPAGAGITPTPWFRMRRGGAYPRGRGDHPLGESVEQQLAGLPPRARGSRQLHRDRVGGARPTPAGAGITTRSPLTTRPRPAYPRGRGDHPRHSSHDRHPIGLPPRARGSHQRREPDRQELRPTPAGAGITTPPSSPTATATAYPRGRGDHCSWFAPQRTAAGLPPRARGSPTPDSRKAMKLGPTPAGAGITDAPAAGDNLARAYPRGRGDHSTRL